MKAIIMAGGEGSRLRPLTCGRPKPMVPLLNRPVMEYCVDLLVKHGIRDIGVTLQYMPEAIRNHFSNGADRGINLHYFVEEIPLGTAGSVKNAGSFLDETFVVVSGDALTDLDLTRAFGFHRQKKALATLVLTRVECPLEYGVVITDREGNITQFMEKPAWGEVFSDTVNTGIYILEPEALEYFDLNRKFDFSQDLFPLLLKHNKPLFGVAIPGYWCDIGNITQYLEAQRDALAGRVQIDIPGEEVEPGVRVGKNVSISSSATLAGPVFIGDNCRVGSVVRIEPYTVLGQGTSLGNNSSLKRSIIWDNCFVGPNSAIRGAVLCSRVKVLSNSSVHEGAVVGSDTLIRENCIIKPEVKIWPNKLVETGTIIQNNVIWGTRQSRKFFGLEGITGVVNVDLTPEIAVKIGAAFGSAMGAGSRLAVSSDNYPASSMFSQSLICGMQSVGCTVLDLGICITPVHRFGVTSLGCRGGIHVKVSARDVSEITLILTNEKGGNISRGAERKIENLLQREDFARVEPARISAPQKTAVLANAYATSIMKRLDSEAIKEAGFNLVIVYDRLNLQRFLEPMAGELNISLNRVELQSNLNQPGSWQEYRQLIPHLVEKVLDQRATMGAIIDPNGDHLVLVDDTGRLVQDELLTALIALLVLKNQGGPVAVPVTAPRAIETMASSYKSRVVRTKTAIQHLFDEVLTLDRELGSEGTKEKRLISQFLMNFDAPAALLTIMEYLARERASLSRLVDEIPAFFLDRKDVPVPWEAKGKVIRHLIEEHRTQEVELLDGVKVFHQDGWALVLPDPEEPVCRVFSEASSMEVAESLTDFYVDKINQIAGTVEQIG